MIPGNTVSPSNGNGAAGTEFGVTSTASCPTGKVLLGGGASIAQGANASAAVTESGPVQKANGATPTQWQARAVIVTRAANGNSPTLTAYAICSA